MTWLCGLGRILGILFFSVQLARNFATKSAYIQIDKINHDGTIEKYFNLTHVSALRDRARNETRNRVVAQTLQAAAGVYKDKDRGMKAGLQKTVFITVVGYNSKENIYHYKVYFRNFLCFAQQYGIDLIVYVLHHHLPDVEEEIRSLEELGVRVLTYPDERFWSLLSEKHSRIMVGKTFALYDSDIPSFNSYGALAMLVPQLEVMEMGYNAIYFDVDIGLVQDPVPFITRGDADFTVSIEQRNCPEEYPTTRRMNENWETLEPNTGVMHLRATSQGIAFYKTWMAGIIRSNVKNDQTVFDRDSRVVQIGLVDGKMKYSELNFTSTFTPTCNWDYRNLTPTARATPLASTYCFLPEMMFQNGLNSFYCSLKNNWRDDWYVEMTRQVPEVQVDGDVFRLPVAVHANYCNAKSHELEVRGLWLYRDEMKHWSTDHIVPSSVGESRFKTKCMAYNVSKVFFALKNFTKEVELIGKHRVELLKEVLVKGNLIKRSAASEVFVISEKLTRRLVPDADTFLSLGHEWDKVKSVPSAVLFMIPEGPPLKSTSTKPPKKKPEVTFPNRNLGHA